MPYNFEAFARIPSRPLSYENRDLAEAKEIVVDYINNKIYICNIDKTLIDVTASVAEIIEEVNENIAQNSTIITNATITLLDGSVVSIGSSILNNIINIKDIQDALGLVKDGDNVTLSINPDSINTDENNRFVTDDEKETWENKADILTLNSVILGGEDNWTMIPDCDNTIYIQSVTIDEILEIDTPIVDIVLSDDYDVMLEELDNYSCIYKIITHDGYAIVYSSELSSINLNIILKVDR